ncbi:MAG: transglycosylase SLT domain-containing protein, partial [Nanoarchaeota archaeon]
MSNKKPFNNKTAKGLISLITIIILLSSILATSIFYENNITANVVRETSIDTKSPIISTKEVNDLKELSQLNEGWYEIRNGYVFYLDTFNDAVLLYIKVRNPVQQNGLLVVDDDGNVEFYGKEERITETKMKEEQENKNKITGQVAGLERVSGFAIRQLPKADLKPDYVATVEQTIKEKNLKNVKSEHVLALGSAESQLKQSANVVVKTPDGKSAPAEFIKKKRLEVSKKYNIPSSEVNFRFEKAKVNEPIVKDISVGPMQISTVHEKEVGIEVYRNPIKNLEYGTIHLDELLGVCKGNFNCAIKAYNQGRGKLDKSVQIGALDRFVANSEFLAQKYVPGLCRDPTVCLLGRTNGYFEEYTGDQGQTLIAKLKDTATEIVALRGAEAQEPKYKTTALKDLTNKKVPKEQREAVVSALGPSDKYEVTSNGYVVLMFCDSQGKDCKYNIFNEKGTVAGVVGLGQISKNTLLNENQVREELSSLRTIPQPTITTSSSPPRTESVQGQTQSIQSKSKEDLLKDLQNSGATSNQIQFLRNELVDGEQVVLVDGYLVRTLSQLRNPTGTLVVYDENGQYFGLVTNSGQISPRSGIGVQEVQGILNKVDSKKLIEATRMRFDTIKAAQTQIAIPPLILPVTVEEPQRTIIEQQKNSAQQLTEDALKQRIGTFFIDNEGYVWILEPNLEDSFIIAKIDDSLKKYSGKVVIVNNDGNIITPEARQAKDAKAKEELRKAEEAALRSGDTIAEQDAIARALQAQKDYDRVERELEGTASAQQRARFEQAKEELRKAEEAALRSGDT